MPSGKRISDETLAWAREAWEDEVQGFYDDPIGYVSEDGLLSSVDDGAVSDAHNRLNRIGQDLGMSMSVTIAREASEFEVARMERLLGA